MKTKKQTQTHPTRPSPAKSRRRAAVAVLAFGTAIAPVKAADTNQTDAIRPFHFHASDKDLADLRRRIKATRWPEKETVGDASQGVQLSDCAVE